MKSEGFDIEIKLDSVTGLLIGGNKHNCGTWMDKMGSAESNKGVPATPRDGAPIEISGLCYSFVSWLQTLYENKEYKHEGVMIGENNLYSFEQWSESLKNSFERCYWIPSDSSEDFQFGCNTDLVHERGIYKDLYQSDEEWRNYQCRPNQVVAMAVAPELFTPKFAREALDRLDHLLISKDSLFIIFSQKSKSWNENFKSNRYGLSWSL